MNSVRSMQRYRGKSKFEFVEKTQLVYTDKASKILYAFLITNNNEYVDLQQKIWVSETQFCYFKNPKVSCSVSTYHVNYGRVISLNHVFPPF